MKKYLFLSAIIFIADQSHARPVSYPGGYTLMESHMNDMTSINLHYTVDKDNAVGYLAEYREDSDWLFNGVSWNHILLRKNMPASQLNFYLKSGAGVAYSNYGDFEDKTEPEAFTGIALDWEDRRYFTMYENRSTYAGDINKSFEQSVMLGIAPYIGDYGDLHTWLMLHVEHKPAEQDNFTVTPMVRFFKGTNLVEVGISENGEAALNFIHRF
jgi:hypothetical protein